MVQETFEQVLTAAQAEGTLTPAWRKFVVTKFFVPIVRSSANELSKFTLRLTQMGAPGAHSIIISEDGALLGQEADGMTTLSGADVVRLLHPEAGIMVAMHTGTFNIAKDKVDWLKKGIEASQARAAAKAREAAGLPPLAAAAPAPAAASTPAAAPAPAAAAPVARPAATPAASPVSVPSMQFSAAAPVKAADTPVARNQRGVLDIAALKPRSVSVGKIGLEFFVPAAWKESTMSAGLRFSDPDSSTVVEATGSLRPDVSLAQWQSMRMALIQHERRYLTQDGEPYPLDGEGWRSRVKGMATEFTGTFPGDDVESRFLQACIWIDGTVVSITVRATREDFENNRQLYKWLLGRVDINEAAASAAAAPAQSGARAAPRAVDGFYGSDACDPGVFGMNMEGRIGRLRAMAYSFPIMGAAMAAIVLCMLMMGKSPIAAGFLLVSIVVATAYTCLRLMVLRLHDVNMSGKWILGFIAAMIVASATRSPLLLLAVSGVFWLLMMVVYCIIPGTDGDNDFGPPPLPNTALVNVGAGLYILLQVVGLTGGAKTGSDGMENFSSVLRGDKGSGDMVGTAAMQSFSPYDHSFTVDLPGQPKQVSIPYGQGLQMRQYQLTTASAAYVMQTLSYGSARFDQVGAMEKLKAGVLEGGVLISDSLILFNGNKGREVRARMPNQQIRAARYVLANGKLCMAMILTSDTPAGLALADDYLASFEVR